MDNSSHCATRLRKLRNLANLSRNDLCEITGININTLIGWEVGRHGGLSKKGATKIIEAINKQYICCNLTWLMEGIGIEPYSIKFSQTSKLPRNNNLNSLKELDFFKQLHPDSIHFIVNDKGMLPEYEINDIVASPIIYTDFFEKYINKVCIVIDQNNYTYLRTLRKGSISNSFNLICTNNEFNIPVIYEINIKYIAPIKWHRKVNPD